MLQMLQRVTKIVTSGNVDSYWFTALFFYIVTMLHKNMYIRKRKNIF
jgi:hypothetical protein